MTTDPNTPTVPEGWVAVPVSEVAEVLSHFGPGHGLPGVEEMRARLPKPPAWTDEDVRTVREATHHRLFSNEAEAVLAALAAAGRLKEPTDERD